MDALKTPEDVQRRVLAITSEVLAVDEPLDPKMNLREDLEADSLSLIMLFMALEDEFAGTISQEEVDKINTLDDIIDYINGRIAEAQTQD